MGNTSSRHQVVEIEHKVVVIVWGWGWYKYHSLLVKYSQMLSEVPVPQFVCKWGLSCGSRNHNSTNEEQSWYPPQHTDWHLQLTSK